MNRLDACSVPLSGIHLVEASAGTGKTYAIATLYLRAVVEQGLLPEQILVVTFTRAATSELKERIRLRLRQAQTMLERLLVDAQGIGDVPDSEACLRSVLADGDGARVALERLKRALLVIDDAAVLTIHGFCGRVLESHAFESNLRLVLKLVESVDDLVEEIVTDFCATRLATLSVPWLLALEHRGLDVEQLRRLAATALASPEATLEPEQSRDQEPGSEVFEPFERAKERALSWLQVKEHERCLAPLVKSWKGGAPSKKIQELLRALREWLVTEVAEIEQSCKAFETLRKLAIDNPTRVTPELEEFLAALDDCDEAYRRFDEAISAVALELRRDFVLELRRELARRKSLRELQGYDDLLSGLHQALTSPDGEALAAVLRAKYPLGLIDEFQDTDPIQYEVFSRIYAEKACLFMIGDPKQSIYGFRGADVDNYLRAAKVVGDHRHTLAVNYRSDPGLLRGVERLYRGHADPFFGAGIEFVPVSARPQASDLDERAVVRSGVELIWFDSQSRPPEQTLPKYRATQLALKATVSHVRRILGSGIRCNGRAVRPSDIAVLSQTNRESRLVARALRMAGLRCVETGDGSVLDSESALSLLRLLRAVTVPNDLRALATLLLDPLVGICPADLPTLRGDDGEIDNWVARLFAWQKSWSRVGVLGLLGRLFTELSVPERLAAMPDGERRLTDLTHVAELLQATATRQRLGLERQIAWLERARMDETHCSTEERQLRVESDAQAVMATTIHRSKGLEYRFVICPFLWNRRETARRLPAALSFRRRIAADTPPERILHLDPASLDKRGSEWESVTRDALAEASRLIYVALTRARHHAAVMVGPVTGLSESALGRILFEPGGAADEDHSVRFETLERRFADGALRLRRSEAVGDVMAVADEEGMKDLCPPSRIERMIGPSVQTTSYSALVSERGRHQIVEVPRAERDIDATISLASEVVDEPKSSELGETPMGQLGAGAKTGEALHALFEEIDFATFDGRGDTAKVTAVFERFGVAIPSGAEALGTAIGEILDVELSPRVPGLRLRRIERRRRLTELEFTLAVSQLGPDKLADSLGPGLTGMSPDYQEELRTLGFEPLSGYVRGFIDLVFEYEGRYYVADYKSNWLGANTKDYVGEGPRRAMRQHHYPVQAALYAAAIDRWLGQSLAGYDYETHFGGVFYLFLRGMHPSFPQGTGVHFHRADAGEMERWLHALQARRP